MRALIASGSGRYADPWHPFPRTSPLLAEILHGAGSEVSIEHDVDAAMRSLTGVDLLVVNAGDPWRAKTDAAVVPAASLDGFDAAMQRGIGVLALHCAVASLRDYPEWAASIGGMWVPGSSFHPPLGDTEVFGSRFPSGVPVHDFTVVDERYSRLQRIGRSAVIAQFTSRDGLEPAAWVRQVGAARIAVDVLGHDERSYVSEGHRRLIAQLAVWAGGAQD